MNVFLTEETKTNYINFKNPGSRIPESRTKSSGIPCPGIPDRTKKSVPDNPALDPAYRAEIAEAEKNGSEIVGCNPEFAWCGETPVVNVWLFNIVSIIACGAGLPLIQINLDILFSKILGPIKQGTLQGIFVGSGQALNVFGPVLLSQIYTLYGPKFIWGFEIFVCAAAIAMFFFFWERVLSWNERNAINRI